MCTMQAIKRSQINQLGGMVDRLFSAFYSWNSQLCYRLPASHACLAWGNGRVSTCIYTLKPLVSSFFRSLFKLFQIHLRVMLLVAHQPAVFVFCCYLFGLWLLRFAFNEAGRTVESRFDPGVPIYDYPKICPGRWHTDVKPRMRVRDTDVIRDRLSRNSCCSLLPWNAQFLGLYMAPFQLCYLPWLTMKRPGLWIWCFALQV